MYGEWMKNIPIINEDKGYKQNLEKLQQELQLKDKVIDLMIEDIKKADEFFNNQGFYSKFVNASKEYVLNSYINKVKGE